MSTDRRYEFIILVKKSISDDGDIMMGDQTFILPKEPPVTQTMNQNNDDICDPSLTVEVIVRNDESNQEDITESAPSNCTGVPERSLVAKDDFPGKSSDFTDVKDENNQNISKVTKEKKVQVRICDYLSL